MHYRLLCLFASLTRSLGRSHSTGCLFFFFFLFLLHRIDSVYRIVHTRTLHPNYSPNISRGHSLRLGPQKLDVFVAVQITHSLTIMAYFHQLYAINQKTLFVIVSVLILHLSVPLSHPTAASILGLFFSVCAFVLQCHPFLIFVYRYVPSSYPCRSNHDLYMFYASLLSLIDLLYLTLRLGLYKAPLPARP
jgi:hypothetical protein